MLAAAMPGLAAAEARLEFNRDVRPILSDRCFFCHGTDAAHRKGDLRLDQREEALKALAPGDAAHSEVVRRILSEDADEVMPPPETNLSLSAEEKEVLRTWIAQGAEYQGHWAFQPVAAPAVPAVPGQAGRVRNEIDAFAAARLEEAGLALQPLAAPGRLLRRLSFDLTGLPPSLEELDAFEAGMAAAGPTAAPGAAAVAAVVDRLLASPHFGERMAADWLDVARFADTFGYQEDAAMNVWPWRDWVIRAFNENLPHDQFITWQLAGDLLPGATREQRLATAFNRLHRQTNEGGSVNEEFRVEYVSDRVETYGMAFLGLTVGCAKCHDHKYDPLTQRDYFSLFSYFQNIDESGLYSHFTDATPTPALSLGTVAQEREHTLTEARVTRAEAGLALDRGARRAAFESWLASGPHPPAPLEAAAWPDEVGRFSFDEIKDGRVANALNEAEPGVVFDNVAVVPGPRGSALLLSGENNVNLALGGTWTRDDAFSFSLWLKTPEAMERAVVFHRSKAWTDAASNGYELLIEDGRLSAALVHFWPGNALRVVARDPLPLNAWTHVVWSYDGSSRAAGLRLFVNGAEAAVEVVRDALTKDINRGGENRLTIGQRFRDRGFKGGEVDDLRVFARALTSPEAAWLSGSGLPAAAPQAGLFEYFLAAVDETHREKRAALRAVRQARSAAGDALPEIMTMREMAVPKPAFVLARGAYDARTTPVSARPPEFLPRLPDGAPANRLGLARWTVARENPLTARVIVNRLWQSLFGTGLVRTPEDFGVQGALPSHPELLDFLAHRFVASGWDYKALVRLIVTSGTYLQDSAATAEARAADPDNLLLSRGPAFRLSAEQIRDQALRAAGQLDPAIGGPSVDPDQASRRSLYTFWKRTMPDVRMDLFDMAKREVCSARRPVTHTPLQALTLLNEPRFAGWARQLAATASAAHADDTAAITAIFRQLTSQRPTERQLGILRDMLAEQSVLSGAQGEAARRAGLNAVAQAAMNFDESVMKR